MTSNKTASLSEAAVDDCESARRQKLANATSQPVPCHSGSRLDSYLNWDSHSAPHCFLLNMLGSNRSRNMVWFGCGERGTAIFAFFFANSSFFALSISADSERVPKWLIHFLRPLDQKWNLKRTSPPVDHSGCLSLGTSRPESGENCRLIYFFLLLNKALSGDFFRSLRVKLKKASELENKGCAIREWMRCYNKRPRYPALSCRRLAFFGSKSSHLLNSLGLDWHFVILRKSAVSWSLLRRQSSLAFWIFHLRFYFLCVKCLTVRWRFILALITDVCVMWRLVQRYKKLRLAARCKVKEWKSKD